MAYTAPTVRTTGELITASIWNTDLVANIAYFKASPTFDGTIGTLTAGTHTFTGSSATFNKIILENTTSGATAVSQHRMNAGAASFFVTTMSEGFTPSGADLAAAVTLQMSGAGGISINAATAASTVRIYGANTLSGTFASTGLTLPGVLNVTGLSTLNSASVTTTLGVTGVATFTAQSVFLAGASVRGAEGGNATLELWADEGDDAPDKWSFIALAGSGLQINQDATSAVSIFYQAGSRSVQLNGGAFGTGAVTGTFMSVDRNSSGGGAPGCFVMVDKGGTSRVLWTDSAGNVRVNNSQPTETSGDLTGTVVGTQTSTRESKDISGEFTNNAEALDTILNTPLWNFRYKSGAYSNQKFVGITTDDSPIFGMDQGRSFNPVTTCAYLMAAVKELSRKLARLEAHA